VELNLVIVNIFKVRLNLKEVAYLYAMFSIRLSVVDIDYISFILRVVLSLRLLDLIATLSERIRYVLEITVR